MENNGNRAIDDEVGVRLWTRALEMVLKTLDAWLDHMEMDQTR